MGSVKRAMFDSWDHHYRCPICADEFDCTEQQYNDYTELGHCDCCEHSINDAIIEGLESQ